MTKKNKSAEQRSYLSELPIIEDTKFSKDDSNGILLNSFLCKLVNRLV